MSIASEITRLQTAKANIKSAIEAKGVTVGNVTLDLYPSKISLISGTSGNDDDDMSDINKVYYIDHTGHVHYSYTLQEFLALLSEPANPSFTGLTPTGWQMSLTAAKAFVTANGFGPVIGLTYTTNDGTTRIYINISDDYAKNVELYYSGLSKANKTKLKIDWGDNSEMSLSSSTYGYLRHTYSQQGEYIIKYIPENSTIAYVPSSYGSSSSMFGSSNASVSLSMAKYVYKIEYGGNISGYLGAIPMINLQSVTMPLGCCTSNMIGGNISYIFPSGGTTNSAQAGFNLKNIIIPEGFTTTSISSRPYLNRAVLPSTITDFPAFTSDVNLLAVNIPSGVTSLDAFTFLNCKSLKKIVIPNTVTTTGNSCFRSCYSLESITLSNKLTTFGTYPFTDCYNLKSILLPSTLTSLGSNTFLNCYLLEGNITIPSGVTIIPGSCFNCCYKLLEVTMHNLITSIEGSAFSYCYSFTSILFPTSLTSLGDSAFASCYNLTGILNIPEGVTTIGATAFLSALFKITEIIIPSTVTSIGKNAFSIAGYSISTVSSKIVHVKATIPPTAGTTIFNTIAVLSGKLTIYVPAASVDAYKTATNWKTYASIIEAEPTT